MKTIVNKMTAVNCTSIYKFLQYIMPIILKLALDILSWHCCLVWYVTLTNTLFVHRSASLDVEPIYTFRAHR